jgi:hypothetical protein
LYDTIYTLFLSWRILEAIGDKEDMCRLEDNIKNKLAEIELEDMDWIRLVNKIWFLANGAMNFLVLKMN